MLTKEQQKIAEENHNLIYSFLNKYNLDIEEYYDIVAIGYCQGIGTFNTDKNVNLSVYLYKCMANRVKTSWRKKCIKTISLETPIGSSDGCDEICLLDTIQDNIDVIDTVSTLVDYQNILDEFSKRETQIINLNTRGCTQRDISKVMNISQPYVSRILNKIKSKIIS